MLAGVLFTAGPAWMMSRTSPLEALSSVGRSVIARSFVPRDSLLIVQVALSLLEITQREPHRVRARTAQRIAQTPPAGYLPTGEAMAAARARSPSGFSQ